MFVAHRCCRVTCRRRRAPLSCRPLPSLCHLSPCCLLPLSCRPLPCCPMPIFLLPVALVVPRVAVVVPRRRTARRRCCAARRPADPCHCCVARRRPRAACRCFAPCRHRADRHRRCVTSSCHPLPRPAESCFCPLPLSCCPLLSLCSVAVLPVTINVPRCRAASRRRCAACCPAAHCCHRVARPFCLCRRAAHRHHCAAHCCAVPCRRHAARCHRRAMSLCRLLPSALPSLPGGGVAWFVDLFMIGGDRWEAVLILHITT
jgi:hypothetical protein